jgi:hypothetical protein
MGLGVSSGGGQRSLGYLFGSGEAPKPAATNAETAPNLLNLNSLATQTSIIRHGTLFQSRTFQALYFSDLYYLFVFLPSWLWYMGLG